MPRCKSTQTDRESFIMEPHEDNHTAVTRPDLNNSVNQPAHPWQRQQSWWLRCFGWVDIISAALNTIILLCHLFNKSAPDAEMYLWWFFIGSMAFAAGFLQGLVLNIRMNTNEHSSMLWHYKLWILVQLLFISLSVLQLFWMEQSYGAETSKTHFHDKTLGDHTVVCLY